MVVVHGRPEVRSSGFGREKQRSCLGFRRDSLFSAPMLDAEPMFAVPTKSGASDRDSENRLRGGTNSVGAPELNFCAPIDTGHELVMFGRFGLIGEERRVDPLRTALRKCPKRKCADKINSSALK